MAATPLQMFQSEANRFFLFTPQMTSKQDASLFTIGSPVKGPDNSTE